MTDLQVGILLASATTFCWTFGSIFFELAGRRIGSVPLNLLRLGIAIVLFCILRTITSGSPLPLATPHQWLWLGLSGVVGFFLCDLCLFRAFVVIGARLSQLMMALAPIFAAVAGYLVAHEVLTTQTAIGITITLLGVAWALWESRSHAILTPAQLRVGVALGLVAAVCQGVGMVCVRQAVTGSSPDDPALTPVDMSLVRAWVAIPCFIAFIIITRRTRDTLRALSHRGGMLYTTLGAIMGPFLGVGFWMASAQFAPSAVVVTVTALVPITVIPLAILIRKDHVTWRVLAGSLLAVSGVIVMALQNGG